MKILIVADTYYPHINGASYFAQRLAHAMSEQGHTVAVIAPSQSFACTKKIIHNIPVFGVTSFPMFFYNSKVRFSGPFFIKKFIRRVLAEFAPDIIHLQTHFFICRTALALAEEQNIPVVVTNHFMPDNLTHYLPLPKNIIKKIDERMWKGFANIFNRIKRVTTPTEIAANLIRPRLKNPVTVVSCGIDLKKFNPENNGDYLRARYHVPTGPVLLYVGRLDKEKKLDEVLLAVEIAGRTSDFSLVIAGTGAEEKKLKNLVRSLGIDERVAFTGFVPDVDLPNLYAIAECFIIAGIAELQSIVTMEAMATGLPIIGANAHALPELIENGVNGILFTPGNISEIADGIVAIFTNDTMRHEYGMKSLNKIAEHDIRTVIKRFEKLYEGK